MEQKRLKEYFKCFQLTKSSELCVDRLSSEVSDTLPRRVNFSSEGQTFERGAVSKTRVVESGTPEMSDHFRILPNGLHPRVT